MVAVTLSVEAIEEKQTRGCGSLTVEREEMRSFAELRP